MNCRKRKQLSSCLQSNAAKAIIKFKNNSKTAKQVANGYIYKWKKTKEENNRLLCSASCNFLTAWHLVHFKTVPGCRANSHCKALMLSFVSICINIII